MISPLDLAEREMVLRPTVYRPNVARLGDEEARPGDGQKKSPTLNRGFTKLLSSEPNV